jgi:hypothetical protein
LAPGRTLNDIKQANPPAQESSKRRKGRVLEEQWE